MVDQSLTIRESNLFKSETSELGRGRWDSIIKRKQYPWEEI